MFFGRFSWSGQEFSAAPCTINGRNRRKRCFLYTSSLSNLRELNYHLLLFCDGFLLSVHIHHFYRTIYNIKKNVVFFFFSASEWFEVIINDNWLLLKISIKNCQVKWNNSFVIVKKRNQFMTMQKGESSQWVNRKKIKQ